jgi:transcription antitermination factor NusG
MSTSSSAMEISSEPKVVKSDDNVEWFALYVKPRHEKLVGTMLRHRGYCEFTPLYTRCRGNRGRDLPLFPGYVFCQFNWERRLPIVSLPGVFFVVGNGRTPTPVAPDEVLRLRNLAASDLEKAPVDYLTEGQMVRLVDGPLRGLDGILQDSGSAAYLVVSVTLLRRSIQVKIDPRWVAPVGREVYCYPDTRQIQVEGW